MSRLAASTLRTVLLTALAMAAFAGNSLLCRVALKGTAIDAASFSAIRLVSGALVLWALASVLLMAALGGIVFLGEPLTLRLVLASAAILGGIALVVLPKRAAPGGH